jgi:hypothetical protein
MPADRGSRLGIRFPTRPPRALEPGGAGPEVPNGWAGTSGVADGLLKRAILSLSDPETALALGSPPGEEERELSAGGVRDLPSRVSCIPSSHAT